MKIRTTFACSLIALAGLFALSPSAEASPVNGDAGTCSAAEGYNSKYYTLDINGGERTSIELSGDGSSDLDLFVYDEFGNLIVSDVGFTDHAGVWVYSDRPATLTIRIRNLGPSWNDFCLYAW